MTVPRQCVLLVGGHGTRMRPLTDTRPKHLLPVGGVPLIDLLVDRLRDLGVARVVLATSVHADRVEEHLASRADHLAGRGLECVVSREPEPLGTGGAIVTAAHRLEPSPEDPLLVVNGDLLTAHDPSAQTGLLDDGTDVVLHVRPAADPAPFGTVLTAPDGRVVAFREKVPGAPGTLVNAGTYVVRAGLLTAREPYQPASWERQDLPALLEQGTSVRAYEEDAWFADVGSPAALVAASVAALTGAARGALPRDYDPARGRPDDLVTGDGATVARDVSLGARVHVREQAELRRSVLLDGVEVGPRAVVEDCVLGEGVSVGAGARLHGCAVGDGAMVPEGAVLTGALLQQEGRTA